MDKSKNQDGRVGDLAVSGTGEPQPLSEPEPSRPAPKIDSHLEGLIVMLGDLVSADWPKTFPPTGPGYAKLQRLLNRYGYEVVRQALVAALDARMVPMHSAYGLLTELCERRSREVR